MKKLLDFAFGMFKKYKEAILYLIFGFLTTLVNAIVYFPVYHFSLLAFNDTISYNIGTVAAWIVAVSFAFVTNKLLVFESTSKEKKTLMKEVTAFFSARLLSLLVTILIMFVGNDVLHIHNTIVYIIAQIFTIVFNYFASKIFIFRKRNVSE